MRLALEKAGGADENENETRKRLLLLRHKGHQSTTTALSLSLLFRNPSLLTNRSHPKAKRNPKKVSFLFVFLSFFLGQKRLVCDCIAFACFTAACVCVFVCLA
jgi:hypothetical protein